DFDCDRWITAGINHLVATYILNGCHCVYSLKSCSIKPAFLTVLSSSTKTSNNCSILLRGKEFGPSQSAWSGLGWVSINSPSTPAPTAARASTGICLRAPPEVLPWPPGNCTE